MRLGLLGCGACVMATVSVIVSPASAMDAAAAAPPGALACSGCHGAKPVAGAPPGIVGRPAPEITAALTAFRSGARASSVMGRIAVGFSPDEDRAIAVWLEQQR